MSWTTPRTWVTNEVVTSSLLTTHVRDNLSGLLPIGTLILRVAAYSTQEVSVEGRWLQCNGYAISRTTYADLCSYFNSMSPALPFGNGDGSTTFNLPDLRGRAVYAEGEHADVDSMGDGDGYAVASRTPVHKHSTGLSITIPGGDATGQGGTKVVIGGGGTLGNADVSASVSAGPGASPTVDKVPFLVIGSYFIKYTN